LKPFYIRTETEKDIGMCCCKLHLHARWAIEGIIKSAELHGIDLTFSSYTTFFEMLTQNCPSSPTAYIDWSCSPNKKDLCHHIQENWNRLSGKLKELSNDTLHIPFTTFDMIEHINQKGKTAKHLKPVCKESSLKEIVVFLNGILPNIVNHRNHLHHYRNVIQLFRNNFHVLFMDIDFSENLTIPVKFEPQSMHWYHETVTIPSGIIKLHGNKSYHPYISDDKKHDQKFVKIVLEEMLETLDSIPEMCVIESDNCSGQYKSAQHFYDIQELSNKLGTPIVRLFSIAGHGKGEVDHVGGLAKCALRRYIGTGGVINTAADCVSFLKNKFGDNSNPTIVKELQKERIDQARADTRLKRYPTIEGSDRFQVMVYTPNATHFKAASHLCVCDASLQEYGSCSKFCLYHLQTRELKKTYLHSKIEPPVQTDDSNSGDDFILPDTYCAVAADKTSPETVWFIKVINSIRSATNDITDDYGVCIASSQKFLEGEILEKVNSLNKGSLYKKSKKKTFFFRESVVYPFVQLQETKKGLFLSTNELVEIL